MFREHFATAAVLLSTPVWAQIPAQVDSDTELSPITVTADPFARRNPVEASQASSVLRDEDLQRARSNTLGDTLAQQPGVHNADFAAGAGRPVIRGLGGPRIKILDGGSSVADASALSPDHNVAIEPFRAQQIEILKGPASLLYGSGAIGGVINVVSDLVPTRPEEHWHGAFGLGGHSVNDDRAAWGHLGTGFGPWALHIDGLDRQTRDYRIPGPADADEAGQHAGSGRVDNSATDTQSYGLGLSFTGEQGYLGLGISRYTTRYGVPGHAHGHDEHEDEHDDPHEHAEDTAAGVAIDMRQTRAIVRGGWHSNSGPIRRLRGHVSVSRYEHQEIEPVDAHEGSDEHTAAGQHGTLFENDSSELRLEATHQSWHDWQGVFGLQAQLSDFSARGEEAVVPPVDTRSLGFFLLEERMLGAHRLSLGGRLEQVDHQPQGFHHGRYNLLNLSSSLHFELPHQQHLRLGLTRAQRAPAVQELYSNGAHLASGTYDRGNGELDSETALHLDLGWSLQGQHWTASVDLFHTDFQDFIFAGEIDADQDGQADRFVEAGEEADEGLLIVQYQQSDARFWGGEAQVKYHLSPQHRLGLFGDLVRASKANGGTLPRTPGDRLGVSYDYTAGPLDAGIKLTRVMRPSRLAALETPTDGYTLLSADVSWILATAQGDITLSLRGRNLLDKQARNHVSFLKNLAPLPGRNLGLSVEYTF